MDIFANLECLLKINALSAEYHNDYPNIIGQIITLFPRAVPVENEHEDQQLIVLLLNGIKFQTQNSKIYLK